MADARNVLRTKRTYASYKNALEALGRASDKIGATGTEYRYLIASNPEGRFAPVVMLDNRPELMAFIHEGVTVV